MGGSSTDQGSLMTNNRRLSGSEWEAIARALEKLHD